jgi:hypothetical protein
LRRAWHQIQRRLYGSIVAAAHKLDSAIFLFDQFQIGLLPDWNPIKLAPKAGIVPVGCQAILHFTK